MLHREPASLTILTDKELLEALCTDQDDHRFYEAFIERFLTDVTQICARICNSRNIDRHVGQQIAHQVFERVRKYKSFKSDEIHLPNERAAILAYLNRIATRLFYDHHKQSKKELVNHKTYFEEILSGNGQCINVRHLKEIKDLASLLFKQLNKKEQQVILADIEYKKHHRYLPDDVTERLALELGIQKSTVRKIRERAINKIKSFLNGINQQ